MKKKSVAPQSSAVLSPVLAALVNANELKRLYRQGWLRRGIAEGQCESVADHIFSMTLLAWFLADANYPELDRDRVIRLVLAHELGEIATGDLTPIDGVDLAEKHRREWEGVEALTQKLANRDELRALWKEFEDGVSAEAQFVRQIDRLEMALQAWVYEHQGDVQLGEFFAATREALNDPVLIALLEELQSSRKM